jgi:predicted nuclease with TOPRIM domain
MELDDWNTSEGCQSPQSWLDGAYTDDLRELIDPRVFPETDLREDLLTLQIKREETKERINELSLELDRLYKQSDCPEYKRQMRAARAQKLEEHLEDRRSEYVRTTAQLAVVRSISAVRERFHLTERDPEQFFKETSEATISAAIERALRDQAADLPEVTFKELVELFGLQ